MPLYKDNGTLIALKGEMPGEDFEWKIMSWYSANFSSPQYYSTQKDDADKVALATFLSREMRGPYFVLAGFANTREVLRLFILHPDDRDACRAYLKGKRWEEKPKAVEKNVGIIQKQIAANYQPRNARLQELLAAVSRETLDPNPAKAAERVDAVIRTIWPAATA